MIRTEWLQETRKMRFEEGWSDWQQGRFEAANVEVRTHNLPYFRCRHFQSGLENLSTRPVKR